MKIKQHIIRSLVSMLILCIGLTGCDRNKSGNNNVAGESNFQGKVKTLILYCGAGIRPPVAELIKIFAKEHKDIKIEADYAGSEILLSKIKLTRKGDLYMPGDKHYVEQAAERGMIVSSKDVCYFVPVIMVQKGNPKHIKTLRDLLKPGLKVGLGDPRACAIGRKTRKILAKNNILFADIEKNVKFQSQTVNELGLQIYSGSLDAVIVWDAIARYYKDSAGIVPIPASQNIISTVRAGVLKFSGYKNDAREFIDFMISQKGRAVFQKHGYTVTLDVPGTIIP